MKTLTQQEIIDRNYWFKHIFFPFANTVDLTALPNLHSYNTINPDGGVAFEDIVEAAKELKNVIINIKMTNCNNSIDLLAKATFTDPNSGELKKYSSVQIADYLASFCKEKEIYFDDYIAPKYTAQEINVFKTQCYLGKALIDFDCFVSADPALQQSQPQPQQAARPTATPRSSSGGQLYLSNAAGLVQPAVKVNLAGDVYYIKGRFADITAKTAPRAHVSPLNGTNPLKVKYKSGQGYDDCILFFDRISVADAFRQQVINNCHDPKVDNGAWDLKRFRANPNGYFKVNTEFGEAYIEAGKLHEMLEEYKRWFTEQITEFYKNLD